ncbi:MAG: S8 family serine peptidase [Gemmatimonadaceae bacterium]|nr:S8 family serine peptidase [Gemmatimonadaceae bacterium]
MAYYSASWQFFSILQYSYNFSTDPTPVYLGQHGTDVASFATGEPDGLWGAGVAPRANIRPYKVLPATGTSTDWGPVVYGLNQAYADGVSVVNMSFGNCGALPPTSVAAALQQFTSRVPVDAANPGIGVNLVASAGNGIYSVSGCSTTAPSYPGAYPQVLSVSAIDSVKSRGAYPDLSSGATIDISAPGICVNGLLVGGGANPCIVGTSFAAPHVSGIIAAIRAKYPTWSASFVAQRLLATATPIPGQALPTDPRFGYGLLDPVAAVNVPAPSVSIAGPSSVRPNVLCTWTVSVSGGVPAYSYLWSPGGATTSFVERSFTSSGTLSVTVTDQAAHYGQASKNVTVSANAPLCQV